MSIPRHVDMLSTLPKELWSHEPLNTDLYIDWRFEARTPFRVYVRSTCQKALPDSPLSTSLSPTSLSSFHQFAELPVELQHKIMEMCDQPTLYRLMQASPAHRSQAQRLFWSSDEAWYRISGEWILSHDGFPGAANHCPQALQYIRKLEVTFDAGKFDDNPTGTRSDLASNFPAQKFWSIISQKFPCLTHIALDDNGKLSENESLPNYLLSIAKSHPPKLDIQIFATILRFPESYLHARRELWSYTSILSRDSWQLLYPQWERISVILPHKSSSNLVGSWMTLWHKSRLLGMKRFALLRSMPVEACERYHFHGRTITFTCPHPTCSEVMEKAGDWVKHAILTSHDIHNNGDVNAPRLSSLPPEIEASLSPARESVASSIEEIAAGWGRMTQRWGNQERRALFEKQFLEQLANDPNYWHNVPAAESSLWGDVQEVMNS